MLKFLERVKAYFLLFNKELWKTSELSKDYYVLSVNYLNQPEFLTKELHSCAYIFVKDGYINVIQTDGGFIHNNFELRRPFNKFFSFFLIAYIKFNIKSELLSEKELSTLSLSELNEMYNFIYKEKYTSSAIDKYYDLLRKAITDKEVEISKWNKENR
ncbi:MAG: hypothetical protein WD512_20915 [Candidatus Paceibacterota bacterium]